MSKKIICKFTLVCMIFILESGCQTQPITTNNTSNLSIIPAIRQNNSNAVKKFIAQGVSINSTDEKSRNLVAWAAVNRNLDLVKYLALHGANADQKDTYGNTAIDEAKRHGFHEIANFFDKCWNNGRLAKQCGEQPIHIIDLDKKIAKQACEKGVNQNNICLVNSLQHVRQETVKLNFKIANRPANTILHTKINGSEIAPITIRTRGLDTKNIVTNVYKFQRGLNRVSTYLSYENGEIVNGEIINYSVIADYQTKEKKPSLYAVIIGIDSYENKNFDLENASSDAITFGRALYKGAKNIFNKVNIAYLTKKETTSKKYIINVLQAFSEISPNDFFVFYSASHGVIYNEKYYLVTSNVAEKDQQTIEDDALSGHQLRKLFSHIPTSNKLLLFDSCHAGAVNNQLSQLAQKTVSKLNLTSIAAARHNQDAIEGYADGRGVFTSVLVDGIEGENKADINGDGIIKSEELAFYVNKHVPRIAKTLNHLQIPAIYQTGQIFPITKTRFRTEPVDMTPQFLKKEKINELFLALNSEKITRYNEIIKKQKYDTLKETEILTNKFIEDKDKVIKNIHNNKIKETIDRITFTFEDNIVRLDITDKIKGHRTFIDDEGHILLYIDSYSNQFTRHSVNYMNTPKISKIDIGWHNTFYRVTLHLKKLSNYVFKQDNEGIFIEVYDCYDNSKNCGKYSK